MLGAVAYVEAFLELLDQLESRDIRANRVYVASLGGTGGGLTLAADPLLVAPDGRRVPFRVRPDPHGAAATTGRSTMARGIAGFCRADVGTGRKQRP